jgi:hypothetical protein
MKRYSLTLTNLNERQVLDSLKKLIGQVPAAWLLPGELQLSNEIKCQVTEEKSLEPLPPQTGKSPIGTFVFNAERWFPHCVKPSEKETIQRTLLSYINAKHAHKKNGWVLLGLRTCRYHAEVFMSITSVIEITNSVDPDYYAIPINPESKTWFKLSRIGDSQNTYESIML